MRNKLPALTLWRPWPALILRCGKDPENRRWAPSYRGLLLIHDGQKWDDSALDFAEDVEVKLDEDLGVGKVSWHPWDHPAGLITGVIDLWKVCTARPSGPESRCDCPPWMAYGQNHLRIRDARTFPEPVEHRGQQLWYPSDGAWPAVVKQLEAVGHAQ